MTSQKEDKEHTEVRMELKYCEHCGGLWVREGGAGVYCDKCRSKVDDLPVPKKKPGRINLPVRRKTTVEGFAPMVSGRRLSKGAAAGGAA
jgi:ribosomal protein L37AE/L43A